MEIGSANWTVLVIGSLQWRTFAKQNRYIRIYTQLNSMAILAVEIMVNLDGNINTMQLRTQNNSQEQLVDCAKFFNLHFIIQASIGHTQASGTTSAMA